MRKSINILLIIGLLFSLGLAKNSANIPAQGAFETYLEYGSQSQEIGDKKLSEKYSLDQVTVLGVDYGINDKWAVGLSAVAQSIINTPLPLDQKYISKPTYIELNAKYQIAENLLAFLDYGTTKIVIGKKATGMAEDVNIDTTKTTIGIAASKKCKRNEDITLGAKLGYNMITIALDDALETIANDLPRSSLTLSLGGDYEINELWLVYITGTHTFPSTAVGQYDDDVTGGVKVGFDQQDSLTLGLQVTL